MNKGKENLNKSGHMVSSKRPGMQVLNTSRTKRLLENLTMIPMVAPKTTKRGYNDTVFLASDLVSDQASLKPQKKKDRTSQSRNVLQSTENIHDTYWSQQQSVHNDSLYATKKATTSVNVSLNLNNTSRLNLKPKTARNVSNLSLLNTKRNKFRPQKSQNSGIFYQSQLVQTSRSNEIIKKST